MYYGFDMGGTKIELGVFDAALNNVWQKRVPTPRNHYDELLTTLVDLVHEADAQTGVQGKVGIGVPGYRLGGKGRYLPLTCLRRWGSRYVRICHSVCSGMFASATMPTVLYCLKPGTRSFVRILSCWG
ncbi:N-acetyl-D-glucosamine kinase 2 [Pectobacterium sp. F1-1]|nr:N-acetyl-D-glucosamine kinase 2 [Pectobacterium sp. F1-1]